MKDCTIWTPELAEQKIKECMEWLDMDRMPSCSEIRKYFGNSKVAGYIARTSGFYGWASKLGLETKQSKAQTGKFGEVFAKKWLKEQGFCVQSLPNNYPFDLFVNGCVKIDVKFAHLHKSPKGSRYFSFKLGKKVPTCDIYLLITCGDDGEKTYYVVPSREVQQQQLGIGEKTSIYHRFVNRADIILAYERAFRSVV